MHMGNGLSDHYIGASEIDGNGVFASRDFRPGERIMKAFKRDLIGNGIVIGNAKFINHSYQQNATVEYSPADRIWYLVATKPIIMNSEIVSNYDDNRMPQFIMRVSDLELREGKYFV